MQTRTVCVLAAGAMLLIGAAVAVPIGRDLYRDAPQSAPAASDAAMKMCAEMASGKVDRTTLTKQMSDALTPELLQQVQPQFSALGEPSGMTLDSTRAMPGGTDYVFTAHFSAGDHTLQIYLTPDGKVGGFHVVP